VYEYYRIKKTAEIPYANAKKLRINIKIATCHFVPNSVSYVPVEYYLNWFTFGKVFAKIERVNFLGHSVVPDFS